MERGFSLNKTVLKDNQNTETLISLRIIKDHIVSVGGIKNIDLCPELVNSCSSARRRYYVDLEKKQEVAREKKRSKRKATSEEIDGLKEKRKRIIEAISHLSGDSDKLYDKAESTGNIAFVMSANAMRRGMADKKEELSHVDAAIQKNETMLANMKSVTVRLI